METTILESFLTVATKDKHMCVPHNPEILLLYAFNKHVFTYS